MNIGMEYLKWSVSTVFMFSCLAIVGSQGKSIDRCDFVHELKRLRPQIDYHELNAWTCLAQYQSNFNISLQNSDVSGASYHGLFQISNVFWCASATTDERACKIQCNQLHDAYLKDDFECVEKIYAEHLRIHGNGFSAWPIHQTYCNDERDFIKDCMANVGGKKAARYGVDRPIQLKDKTKTIAEKKANKIYERCELARELLHVHNLPMEQIATWVCIAKYESNYNSSAVGHANADGSLDHGLFQISDIYWCSPPGKGWVCGLSCAKLENSDISDDVDCMKKIYDEHQRLSGNGFNAWSVYKPRCKHNVDQFIAGCFENDGNNEISLPMHKAGITAQSNVRKASARKRIGGAGKIYERCELAKELRYKQNIPKDQIHIWVCLAQTLSSLNTAVEAPKNADGTSSHGLFQISDQYWCEVNGNGNGCQMNCNDLKDGDISDDLVCVQKIFDEHARLFGNGFHAWAPYENKCKYVQPESMQDCFDKEIIHKSDFPPKPTTTTVKPPPKTIGKIYNRCELANELRNVHNIPFDKVHTWVCIANHESRFDTSAIGRLNADGSLDHGLFQISDIYWCSNDGIGKGCNAACTDFRNADISDDVRCVQQIYDEHQHLFGNGFHAWAVYEPHCRHVTAQFTSDCFPNEIFDNSIPPPPSSFATTAKSTDSVISNAIGDQGRAYERCELAKELRYRHNVPNNLIADFVCIALYSSNLATSSVGPNAYGLFQISSEYWCSDSGLPGKQCNIECNKFEDSDITDDYQCALQIYDTHQRLYGNGFSAWYVHEAYCSNGKSSNLIEGCFDDILITQQPLKPTPSVNNLNKVDKQIPDAHDGSVVERKVYKRCELARELRYKHNVPLEQIHTWICIVQRESNFDTSAIGRLNADGSLDNGLFQISDIYWCSNDGIGKGCNAACTDFRNTDISDDVRCVTKIFEDHQRLFGNGFHAWTTYQPYCAQTTSSHTDDCFNSVPEQKLETTTKKSIFVPFTRPTKPTASTTKTTIPKTTTIAATASTRTQSTSAPITISTMTPFKQFKFTTFKPFSFFNLSTKSKPAPTTTATTTTKYPSATVQFVNSYSTSTTRQPVFTKAQQTIPTKTTFAQKLEPFEFTTPRAAAITGTTKTKKHSYAIYHSNFFTSTTTERSAPIIAARTSTAKPAAITKLLTNDSTIVTTAPKSSTSSKFNLFDLYLGRISKKPPQRYIIPSSPPLPSQPISHLSPYTSHTAQVIPFLNTYSLPKMLPSKVNAIPSTTQKPSAQQVQRLFQSQINSIGQSLGIQNSTYASLDSFITSPKGRGPIVLTLPHLLGTDDAYQTVMGLHPDINKHMIIADIEPNTGYPVRAAKRAQLNMFIKKINQIDVTNKLPTVLLPILWLDEGIELNEEMQNMIRTRLLIPLLLLKIAHYGLIAGGALVFIVFSIWYLIRRHSSTKIIPLTRVRS